MPRRRIRFDGRSLFAILLLVVGVVLPLLSAFSAPGDARVAAEGLPTARVLVPARNRPTTNDQRPTTNDQRPTAVVGRSGTPPSVPSATLAMRPTAPREAP